MTTDKDMGTERRDEVIGRILAEAVGKGPVQGPCPTGEQLAALLDGGLHGAERQEVLSHLSNCSPCREAFETAVRISGLEQPDVHRSWWFTGRLVPYAAAAAVLLAVVSGTMVYMGFRGTTGPEDIGMQAKVTGLSHPKEERTQIDTSSPGPSRSGEAAKEKKAAPQKHETPLSMAMTDMPEPVEGDYAAGVSTEDSSPRRGFTGVRPKVPDAGHPPGPSAGMPFSEAPAVAGIPSVPEAETGDEMLADSMGLDNTYRNGEAYPGPVERQEPSITMAEEPAGSGTTVEGYFAKTEPESGARTGAALMPSSTEFLPPPPAKPREMLAETVPDAGTADKPVTVKARGVVRSIDLEKGEIDFMAEGSKEVIAIKAEIDLLNGLNTGDKIITQYEKGEVNVAKRIKKLKAITVPVGC